MLNKEMKIGVDDDQIHRDNGTRNILSNNIKFVSVFDHLDRGKK